MGKTYWLCWGISSAILIWFATPIGIFIAPIVLILVPLIQQFRRGQAAEKELKNLKSKQENI